MAADRADGVERFENGLSPAILGSGQHDYHLLARPTEGGSMPARMHKVASTASHESRNPEPDQPALVGYLCWA